jgi:sugar fermentation stimulation protein A
MIATKGGMIVNYDNIVSGNFISRPNRFISHVRICGQEVICHVKNTGRCKELLTPGAMVYCQEFDSVTRKTKYDLIAVQKGQRLINMDSQAPNKAAQEWLATGGLGTLRELKAEVFHEDSRFDFSFLLDGKRCFLEVKGVTLEEDGVCAFPDAPTQRGVKHLKGLTKAAKNGYGAFVLFVIQMEDVRFIKPNVLTDPAFAVALQEAAAAGVQILAMDCRVTPDSMTIRNPVPVML